MNTTPKPDYRRKKLKGILVILIAIVVTLGANAFLLSTERTVPIQQHAENLPPQTQSADVPTYTLADVAEHNTEESCWMAAYGNVYDVTEYVADQQHPGGQGSLRSGCGEEVTNTFDRIHSAGATAMLEEYKIGILVD